MNVTCSNRCLTKALLYWDFGINIMLPEDHLCPPVCNGIALLNYVLWIQNIMWEHLSSSVCGIDIGTGASETYPLIICKLKLDWSFVATELNDMSSQLAESNISRNHHGNWIHILQAHPSQFILFPLNIFSFTMCNPLYYTSLDKVTLSAERLWT
ncbi:hypothetical protein ARMGADRAFT_941986 [Armillaria gallica]|uniref:Uncharacterized protein n=1 Tax=Armillaria gallica TaxID=47427 RepID=A0A2H3D1N8_ARMGA|nr:hypothetical protein ARMGADRAFT_941986 [Armillaria gallica]